VIWLFTVVTFLGGVVTAMLVFLLFFQREQIQAILRKLIQRRAEARIAKRVGLQLSSTDEPLIYEITFTENVSRHGARVVAKKPWHPNDSILVKLPEESLPSHARITYCQPLKGDEFAMGLQFSIAVYSWDRLPISAQDILIRGFGKTADFGTPKPSSFRLVDSTSYNGSRRGVFGTHTVL